MTECAKHSRLLPNTSVADMESQIDLSDCIVVNDSVGHTPDREANYAILTEDPG